MARRVVAVVVISIVTVLARAPTSDATPLLRLHHIRLVDATTPAALRAATLGVPVNVRVTLENAGSTAATHVRAHLSAPSFNFSIDRRDYGTIPADSTRTQLFTLTAARCPPTAVQVSLVVTSDGPSLRTGFRLPIICPKVLAASLANTGSSAAGGMGLALGMLLVGLALRAAVSFRAMMPVLQPAARAPEGLRFGSLQRRSRLRRVPRPPRSTGHARIDCSLGPRPSGRRPARVAARWRAALQHAPPRC